MRIPAAILLSATCFFVGIRCYSQDPCAARYHPRPTEESLTATALAHRALLQTPPDKWREFTFGDVEFILRCGTQEDADRLFAVLHNTSTQMPDATVLEVSQDLIRVATFNDGFQPNLGAFWFAFKKPLTLVPNPGAKVIISGTYSSYSRAPFQINLTSSSLDRPRPQTRIIPR
jgi:hypothetical protein